MPKSFEEISKSIASQNGKTDANLANDSNHLGGIPAEDYATKEWVKEYHGNKESTLTDYINQQDAAMLNAAKEYTNSAIRNQDFSDFAEIDDLQALNTNLTNKINTDIAGQKAYTDQKTQAIVDDVNANFEDVGDAIDQLNDNVNDLFQSVSSGKAEIAEAITDKGVATSATASFETMANNIGKIDTGGSGGAVIVIPDGYLDTSDATAGPGQILQGYTAYSGGTKVHGAYVPSGGGSTGGIILGEDEVVATKIYGEAGILTGGKVSPENITINAVNYSRKIAFLSCSATYGGDYVIADRKITENIDNEIVIYNISNAYLSHKSASGKFSYTYSELGIEGEILCIAASPLHGYKGIVQFSIGTSVGIYTYYFNPQGNNGNGSIGDPTIYSSKQKMVINRGISGYNAITYSNNNENVFAYHSGGKIYIVNIGWSTDNIIGYTEVSVDTYQGNVNGLFRFSLSDRFLTFASWGNFNGPQVGIMLLNDYFYMAHQQINETQEDSDWYSGQIAISPDDKFAIINGKLYQLTYDLEAKNISWAQLSSSAVIPYMLKSNESLYACFSSNGKYVYACANSDLTNGMRPLNCFKVDYTNLNSQWQNVSNPLLVPLNSNGVTPPVFDLVNNKIVGFCPNEGVEGFYYYYLDPNVREVIGLSWNGNLYRQVVG